MTQTQDDPAASAYSAIDLQRRANGGLARSLPAELLDPSEPPMRGDHDLNPTLLNDIVDLQIIRPAAVLVPVIDRQPEATVLLTTRADHLPNHAGQVSFPGGKMEAGDSSPVDTALREAEEEIGLDPSLVNILGYLDVYQTGTGFRIVPVVGIVRPEFTLVADETEVADIFEVPLRFLMSARNHEKHTMFWRGRDRTYYAMPYEERYIWGATAGMIRNLFERFYSL